MEVTFDSLTTEQKSKVLKTMLIYRQQYNYPSGAIWNDAQDIRNGIDMGYSPDLHYNFKLEGEVLNIEPKYMTVVVNDESE